MSEMNALKELHKVITKNAPLLPLEYRTDRQKRDFIQLALVGVPWAEPDMNRCASVGAQFQELYAELEGALQLNREGRITNAREDGVEDQKPVAIPAHFTAGDKHVVIPTHYANQGLYAPPNEGFGGSVKGGHGGGAKLDPLSNSGCFNSDANDHVMRACKKPVDYVKAAQRKLAY